MLARVSSCAVFGIEAYPVEVEVDISNGLPAFNMVGLPDTVCRESMDRVRAAMKNSGYSFPSKRITVNLAPADLKKEGSSYDLAIAIGILVAAEQLPLKAVHGKVFCGELSLDGRVRVVSGILPRTTRYSGAQNVELFLPIQNLNEALLVQGVRVYGVKSLTEVIGHLKGEKKLVLKVGYARSVDPGRYEALLADFSDIHGQAHAKRGLEIAAAGGHNVLMIGPPGSGKTMLAKRLPGILSRMSSEESIETTKIHSVAGLLTKKENFVVERPFRDPHHTISASAMVGGGSYPKPGEVSLAHHGVLFLDELAEFQRGVLEVLRQPLEEGMVTISRTACTLSLPSRFMLVAAMNPCPCGYYTDPKKECSCSTIQIKKYLSKISGPLLDRMDIQLHVPRLKADEIMEKATPQERSAQIRARVDRARAAQRDRYRSIGKTSNAELGTRELAKYCQTPAEANRLLQTAISQFGYSARAYHKCLKVARTIADIEGKQLIETAHVAEAIHYRALDRVSHEI